MKRMTDDEMSDVDFKTFLEISAILIIGLTAMLAIAYG